MESKSTDEVQLYGQKDREENLYNGYKTCVSKLDAESNKRKQIEKIEIYEGNGNEKRWNHKLVELY